MRPEKENDCIASPKACGWLEIGASARRLPAPGRTGRLDHDLKMLNLAPGSHSPLSSCWHTPLEDGKPACIAHGPGARLIPAPDRPASRAPVPSPQPRTSCISVVSFVGAGIDAIAVERI